VKRGARRSNALRASLRARKRVHPITEAELRDIVDIWVDAVFTLTDADLRRMARLTGAQDRRRAGGAYAIAAE
jgi:DSF synthase